MGAGELPIEIAGTIAKSLFHWRHASVLRQSAERCFQVYDSRFCSGLLHTWLKQYNLLEKQKYVLFHLSFIRESL